MVCAGVSVIVCFLLYFNNCCLLLCGECISLALNVLCVKLVEITCELLLFLFSLENMALITWIHF